MRIFNLTGYELLRRGVEPLLPPLYRMVRKKLLTETRKSTSLFRILDVGGRKSPYTVGVGGKITVIDLPRQSEIQKALNLGITDSIVQQLQMRRSNIENFIFGDMTNSGLPDNEYDIVVSVEVLEHVAQDELFLREVSRVLKPGGCFLMTTPNGDFVVNRNPDHKRHYKRTELVGLLEDIFGTVEVDYAIAGGKYRKLGLRTWSATRPVATALSAIGNVVNLIQSARPSLSASASGTHHLVAVARKPLCNDKGLSKCAE